MVVFMEEVATDMEGGIEGRGEMMQTNKENTSNNFTFLQAVKLCADRSVFILLPKFSLGKHLTSYCMRYSLVVKLSTKALATIVTRRNSLPYLPPRFRIPTCIFVFFSSFLTSLRC